jgi:hypothetical protein
MNIFKKNNVLINGLLNDTFNFLQSTYNQTANVFTAASAWGQILFVLQNISQFILYFIEDSITELNIYQATRDYSIRSLARIAGYDPGRASAAQGEIGISWNARDGEVGGGSVIIKNNTQVRCLQNGKIYSIRFGSSQITLPLVRGNSLNAKIAQGTFENVTVTGTGLPLQSFNLPSSAGAYIDQFYVDVYVNEEKWKRYDSFYDIPLGAKGYLVRGGIQEGLDVFFGNSNSGKMPQSGARIRVEYLQTSGSGGNSNSTKENPLTYKFVTGGTDLFGTDLDLNLYLNISNVLDPTFGTNPESTELIKLIAPKTSRSFVFANAENYEIFLSKFGMFSQIHAFSTFDDEYLDDDNVVYIYLVPDVTLNLSTNEDYFNIAISEFLLTLSQKTKIENVIQDSGSMIATTVVKIVEPVIMKYIANVVLIIFEGYDPETIKNEIRSKISDYMLNNKRRDRIPKSDMIAIIEPIIGVDSVSFFFTGQKNEEYQALVSTLTNVSQTQLDTVIGMDEFGDIIIGRNDLVILRGGWTDRNGNYYTEGISDGKQGPLNISISSIVPVNFRSGLTTELKAQLAKPLQ